jgi:hypothetical protein
MNLQKELESFCDNNQIEFWKSIGRMGISQSCGTVILMEIVTTSGISNDIDTVLNIWKEAFSSLFKKPTGGESTYLGFNEDNLSNNIGTDVLTENISILEVKNALRKAKDGKSWGYDNIPMEILKNDCSVSFLHMLFNICFEKSVIPSD